MHSIMQTLSRSKHKPSGQNAVGPNAKSILLMAKGPRGLFIHKGNRLSLTYFSQSGKIANVHSTVEIYYRVPRQDTHTAAVRRGRPAVSAGQIVFSVPRRGPLSFFWAFYGVCVCVAEGSTFMIGLGLTIRRPVLSDRSRDLTNR